MLCLKNQHLHQHRGVIVIWTLNVLLPSAFSKSNLELNPTVSFNEPPTDLKIFFELNPKRLTQENRMLGMFTTIIEQRNRFTYCFLE